MNLTDLFIRRPVVSTVISLLILLAGLQATRILNIRQYPRSDIAVVSVTTTYVGANADLVRGFITTPLERVIASADGIDYIESTSAQSVSTILVHLKLNYDTNAALTQIQAKVAQVRNDLPPEAEAPVIDLQTSDDRFASLYLAFASKDLDQNQITDYLTRVVQPKLTAVSGVQRADILGARTFAMRVWLKPDRMAALGISPSDARNALAANNYLSALGATKGSMISVNLVANTNLKTAEEFGQLVIRQSNGAIVRLKDIADVELGAESYDADVRFDGQKATFMGIWVLPTANSLDVIKAVREELPAIQAQLPAGMTVSVPHDSTEYIQDAIHEVWKTLIETLLLVVLIIYLFLGTIRSILIPVVAIPISLIGAAFLMLVFGFTINLLTLLAIVLSVGLVVDDAIVVVENVERHLQEGATPFQAAIHGARELLGPIIAMSITLAAVYAPIGIQGGLTGALFREFAFTLAGAVVVSGIVAITLSPMMSSKLLRAGDSHKGYASWINHRFEGLRELYRRTLANTLRWWPVTIALAFLIVLPLPLFYLFSSKELAPKEDQGIIFGIVQASPNSTIEQTGLFTEKLYELFKSFPETAHVFQVTMPNSGFVGLVTKPWSQRHRSTQQMEHEVSAKAATVAGVNLITMTPAALPGASNFPVEISVSSTAEPDQILGFAQDLVTTAKDSKIFFFADTDLKFDQPQAEVVFDRDKVASLGLNLAQVGADLGTYLGGNYVNRFSIQGRSYKVIPEAKRGERLTTDQLKDLYVSGPGGKLVQLSTFADIKQTTEPRNLNRFQQ
ncbi:MAG: efflux RND transporter permease subunit, partial [Chthoniobacteraceae bacterium]|nr:efflux RND transporter permease subunit [Chthoniobacteraceae bacterium]